MTDRPMIFSGPMVQALIDGRKTQTRRVIRQASHNGWHIYHAGKRCGWYNGGGEGKLNAMNTPYMPRDRLYVREAWRPQMDSTIWACVEYRSDGARIKPRIEEDNAGGKFWEDCNAVDPDWRQYDVEPQVAKWRSPIFCPRWASRLTLTVTDFRVQRLQDISFADTLAEGIEGTDIHKRRQRLCVEQGIECGSVCRDSFRDIWNSLHGPEAWEANPWVVALTFTVVKGNIDRIGGVE